MPRFTDASEEDALKWILEQLPKPADNAPPPPRIHQGHVQAFLQAIGGHIPLYNGTTYGKELDPPLFKRAPASPGPGPSSMPASPKLQTNFRVSQYQIGSYDEYMQKKMQLKEMDEAAAKAKAETSRPPSPVATVDGQEHEWTQRPDSNSPSTLSAGSLQASNVVAGGSNKGGDGKDHALTGSHTATPVTPTKDAPGSAPYERGSKNDDDDDDLDLALANIATKVSIWAHAKQEGNHAVTEAVVGAPEDTHARVAERDSKMASNVSSAPNNNVTVKNVGVHESGDITIEFTASKGTLQHRSGDADSADEKSAHQEQQASKRAALIAKSKATGSSSIITAQSANEKRAALKKSRKAAQAPLQQHEPAAAATVQQPQEGLNMLLYDNTDDGRRKAIDEAIKAGLVDPDDPSDAESVMKAMMEYNEAKQAKFEDAAA